ncbi:MAG: hypothetical protein ACRD5J_11270, partial [Nitrososphaeraceae archaeon]
PSIVNLWKILRAFVPLTRTSLPISLPLLLMALCKEIARGIAGFSDQTSRSSGLLISRWLMYFWRA